MDYEEFAQDIIHDAIRAGAHEAEAYLEYGDEFSVEVRMGDVETLTQASYKGLGLRVFVDKRMAFASTTDFDPSVVHDLVTRTVELAKYASRDRYSGLPDPGSDTPVHLDLYDPDVAGLTTECKVEMARTAEDAAREFDPRITNSEGARVSTHSSTRIIANSNGVLYSRAGTTCSISCTPVAEQDGEKQTDCAWSAARFLSRLESPRDIGVEAALKTVRKLGGRKVETQRVPVVFDRMVGTVLWGAVFLALDGDNVHRGLSFLKNKLGKRVASPIVTVLDDPHLPGGLGSSPFDGEGVVTRPKVVIDRGILNLYFYDSRTARKYHAEPTGNARRGYSSTPSVGPMNFYLRPTDTDPSTIIQGITNGFYVTDVMGSGANSVTGDFSVGASGMWIKDGELAFPVQEVTIAGNMLDMMLAIEQVANDVKFVSSLVSPTFKVSEMTVSGR